MKASYFDFATKSFRKPSRYPATIILLGIGVSWSLIAAAQETFKPGWPTGPSWRSEGSFHAWSGIPNDPATRLDKLKDIDDVAEVHVHGGGWVVLRKSGQTVSLDGKADRENIRKICHGWDRHFGLITRDGKVLGFHGPGELLGSENIPDDLGPVKDVYMGPHHHAALLEDGSLRVWGRAYDGISEKGNPEWKVKPELPAGRKAVTMSSSDNSFAVQLDDGSLLVWRIAEGSIPLPDDFAAGKVGAFCLNRGRLFAIPSAGGRAISWPLGGAQEKAGLFPFAEPAVATIETGNGVMILSENGQPSVDLFIRNKLPQIEQANAAVNGADPNLISMWFGQPEPIVGRVLWFDGKPEPDNAKMTAAEAPDKPKMSQAPGASEPSAPPTPKSKPPIDEGDPFPGNAEVKALIVAYQTQRRDQLGALATKYQRALEGADAKARAVGDLDRVEAIRKAMERARVFAEDLAHLPMTASVAPLKPLAPLDDQAPPAIQRLRPIFDAESSKIESTLYSSFATSLEALQAELVKGRKIEDAKALQAYRAELAEIYSEIGGAAQATVAATASSVTEPVMPKAAVNAGPIKQGPGALKAWSFTSGKRAINLERAKEFGDFIQVYTWADGWVALRSNGETVTIDGKNERKDVVKICPGWGDAYGLIHRDGLITLIGDKVPSPPQRPNGVSDAFVSRGHCLVLLDDGKVMAWGDNYKRDNKRWPDPPKEALMGVKAIAGSNNIGTVLSDDGEATVWCETGLAKIARPNRIGVLAMACCHDEINFLRADGTCQRWHFRGTDGGNRDDITRAKAVEVEPMGRQVLFRLADDKLRMGNAVFQPEFQDKLESLGRVAAGCVSGYRGGAKDNHVIWIEAPVP